MNSPPFFSVIVPTYNRAGLIGKTLTSVLSQEFHDLELIVVDDGSTDHTEEVVRAFGDPRLRYIKKINGERAAARNAGIGLATGKYVTFLDSDDVVYSNHLAVANNFAVANATPEIFHVAYEIITPDGRVLKRIDRLKNINKDLIMGNPLSCMGVFVRADVMRENLFNEDRGLSGLEDWELWLRIAASRPILAYHTVTSAIVHHEHRSVLEPDPGKLILKMNRFIHHISENPALRQVSRSVAAAMTYTALHLAMTKTGKRDAWHYLLAGVTKSPRELFRKRLVVTLKLIFFG